MKIFFFLPLLWSSICFSLSSPFDSSIPQVSIKNTHAVGEYDKIFRGQAPLGKVEELVEFGITDILIFKNQTKNEIDKEYIEINNKAAGLLNTHQINFQWHDYSSYQLACEQTIEALEYIRSIHFSLNKKLFFHCTVGEDRTGMLAGIWRILSQGYSTKQAFYYEMCENGYGKGNPNKPAYVYNEIRSDLTPLYLYLANKIKTGKLSLRNLNTDICIDNISRKHNLKCYTSSLFNNN